MYSKHSQNASSFGRVSEKRGLNCSHQRSAFSMPQPCAMGERPPLEPSLSAPVTGASWLPSSSTRAAQRPDGVGFGTSSRLCRALVADKSVSSSPRRGSAFLKRGCLRLTCLSETASSNDSCIGCCRVHQGHNVRCWAPGGVAAAPAALARCHGLGVIHALSARIWHKRRAAAKLGARLFAQTRMSVADNCKPHIQQAESTQQGAAASH